MQHTSQRNDWLVQPFCQPASVTETDNRLILGNALIQRTFVTSPNFATVNYTNQITGSSFLRGIKPEVVLTIDGHQFEVGGLRGQPDYAYLDSDWIVDLTSDRNAFQFREYRVDETEISYPWVRRRSTTSSVYPPEGVTLTIAFSPPPSVDSLRVCVHYELYQGIPVLSKWITIRNEGQKPIQLDALSCEILAVNEQEKHRLHVESNYAFSGVETTQWGPDADYKTQVDYHYQMPLLMTSRYPLGPGILLQPGETFKSFRTFEILHDSDDRDRKGLARRKMYRMVAPQVTENPILMHVRSAEPDPIRLAIDQCAEVGFEMVIMTFGSGVIACYRGPRLFDTEETKAVVKKWVDFYKKYRPILDSDLIHVRRPDGRSIDCVLHANAQISPCGLAMLYNPTRRVQQMTLKLPLYYTGLCEIAKIREGEGEPKRYTIDRDYNVEIPIKMEAKSVSYLVIEPEI